MQRKLLFLSFIEGAAVMAAELCGAKLLAPIFGSSLYVWASVMGITLFALALGYFYGGMLSEKSKDQNKTLLNILIVASLLVLIMPVISYYLVPRISYLPFTPAVVISTLCLLFFPVFFLGASSPLFISLQSNNNISGGKVSGTVYAVSTFGGILSTFLCGFYLIPELGLNITMIIFGSLLFIFTLINFKIFKGAQVLIFVGIAYLNLQFIAKKSNQLFSSDSILGHLEVNDSKINGGVRTLKINDIIQTEMDKLSGKSVSAYINLLDTLMPSSELQNNACLPARQALVLGLGGGLTANLLSQKKYKVTGVEFDERIIEVSKNYFNLDKNIECVCEDARYYLNHTNKKFDVVLFDLFKAEEQPSHVLTMESLAQLKNNLKPEAIIYIVWHGYTSAGIGKGSAILNNTLLNSGFNVKLVSTSKDESFRNIIFVTSLNKNSLEKIANQYLLNEKLEQTEEVNTDNKPLLEKSNALANKLWRSNYLKYYQNN